MHSTFMLLVTLVLGVVTHQQPDGKAIFESKGNCFACHGRNAQGTALAPNLTDDTWLHVDGSAEQIVKLISTGVPRPKMSPAPMPPMGGASLTKDEIGALAKYVVSLRGSAPRPAESSNTNGKGCQHSRQQSAMPMMCPMHANRQKQ